MREHNGTACVLDPALCVCVSECVCVNAAHLPERIRFSVCSSRRRCRPVEGGFGLLSVLDGFERDGRQGKTPQNTHLQHNNNITASAGVKSM